MLDLSFNQIKGGISVLSMPPTQKHLEGQLPVVVNGTFTIKK